jgi:MoxR-like ATPase
MNNPFMVIATQNPIEQEGTYRLPEAQLDRFLFKIIVPYPNEAEEVSILQRFHQLTEDNVLDVVEPVISDEQVIHLRQLIKNIVVEEKLIQFIARISIATRSDKSIYPWRITEGNHCHSVCSQSMGCFIRQRFCDYPMM